MARGLTARHDYGSQFIRRAFQNELKFPGIESSPSFVRAPEGNGVAQRFLRTPKEQLLWVESFRTIDDLRAALPDFRGRHNENWILARHGHMTPNQVRAAAEMAAHAA